MLFSSKDAPRRLDFQYEEGPNGTFVGWLATAQPSINRKHVDGPLLYMRNGEMHWLTRWERFLLWLGKTDALTLERKYRPHLANEVSLGAQGPGLDPIARERCAAKNE